MNDLEQKRKNIEKLAKIGALLVVGFFVAPFIFLSIKGLIGLIIASGIGFVAINFIPWFSSLVANWRLKAIKYEASKNPIETLENDYRIKMTNLGQRGEDIRKFGASVGQYESEVTEFSKLYPDRAPTYRAQLTKMRELLEIRKRKFLEAKESLRKYDLEIQKASAEWKMSQSALRLARDAGMSEDDFFNKIKSETALDSVQESLNMAFADLDFALLEEKDQAEQIRSQKQITSGNSPITIDISSTTKSTVKA